jgi:hypothetical protein
MFEQLALDELMDLLVGFHTAVLTFLSLEVTLPRSPELE